MGRWDQRIGLIARILGMLAAFQAGKIVHVPLLVGLLLLLMAFLQARDAASKSAK